jgi:serine/threonine protein kinase/formylglycine-generating enzyme required for sulfatase activity
MTLSPLTVPRSSLDPALADLLEAVAERVQKGEAIDAEALIRDHPQYAEQLQRLLPAVQVMADLSRSSASAHAGADGGAELGELGDYRIVREVGRGGMGIVYEAEQVSLCRRVALKVLPFAATLDPRQLQRFRHEAQAAAMLHHPNIVPVYGVGCERSVHFYAMQLIEGTSLAAALEDLRQSRQPHHAAAPAHAAPTAPYRPAQQAQEAPRAETAPVAALSTEPGRRGREFYRRVAELIAEAADALEYAHSMGVVHRDVKPANLMLDEGGHLWVTDFGLAKLDAAANLTVSGDLLGTLRYMSPEQALARHGLVDHRTDVYSLGATLYELLTLTPAVDGADKQEILKKIAFEEPTAPRKLDKAIPAELETVTLKCLAKNPAERYASAGELAADLRRFLEDRPIRARRVGRIDRFRRWVRRNPALAGLYATLMVSTLAAVTAAFAYQRQQFLQQLARVAAERQTRAAALVDALETADFAGVPVIVRELAPLRGEAEPILRARDAAAAPDARNRLRYALALLPADPRYVDELLAAVPAARPEELLALRDALRDHAARVADLRPRLAAAEPGARLRFAALLAGYLPADERWQQYAAGLVAQLVRLNPLELAAWSPAFEPLHRPLTPALFDNYRTNQVRLKSGALDAQALVEAAAQFDRAASLLAGATADQPDVLAEVLQIADGRHHADFLKSAGGHRATVASTLRAVLGRKPADGATDEAIQSLAERQANVAATLLNLGDPGPAWAMLRHTPDPTARSYLIHALAPCGADPLTLIRRYGEESDVSARRALLLGLGEYDPDKVPAEERQRFGERLLGEYRDHPDAGLHGAIDWLLRQKWGRAAELDRITRARSGRPADGRNWFVNSERQTFTVIRGPVTFTMGSPPDQPGRGEGEPEEQHDKTISRSFAIAARDVTVADILRWRDFDYSRNVAVAKDGPADRVSWYHAAAYCRWLSEKEGVPEDQQCYPRAEEIKDGMVLPADYLSRTGYRLPTEAEWEYACRASTVTARYYGRGAELLERYAWYTKTGQHRSWPCGRLKPNDLGLFDMQGNVWQWCLDALGGDDRPPANNDVEQHIRVSNYNQMMWRGGGIYDPPSNVRSSFRGIAPPNLRDKSLGFRLVRTYRGP